MKQTAFFLASLLVACGSSGTEAGPPADAADASSLDADAAADTAAADAQSDTATPPACATMPFPAPCDSSATTPPAKGELGADGALAVTVETLPNPHASAPLPVSVYLPSGKTGVPVLFFSHAFGATKVESYDTLLRNLASNGIASVYVPYSIAGVTHAERYAQLWDGFVAAATKYASTFDLTHVGFAGHSFGGGAAPEMARRGFVEKGWGSAGRFLFVMAPWYSWGSGYDTLPEDVRTVVQVYADDDTNDHQIAVHDLWEKLPAAMEKRWLLIRSDACTCGLNAGHVVPMTAGSLHPENGATFNGHDQWGVERRLQAIAKYAFSGDMAARAIAYGEDASMGRFVGCGGREVRKLEAATTPIVTTCQPTKYPYAERCKYADPGFTCP